MSKDKIPEGVLAFKLPNGIILQTGPLTNSSYNDWYTAHMQPKHGKPSSVYTIHYEGKDWSVGNRIRSAWDELGNIADFYPTFDSWNVRMDRDSGSDAIYDITEITLLTPITMELLHRAIHSPRDITPNEKDAILSMKFGPAEVADNIEKITDKDVISEAANRLTPYGSLTTTGGKWIDGFKAGVKWRDENKK